MPPRSCSCSLVGLHPFDLRGIPLTCCTGLANVILYTFTRRFFILPHFMRVAVRSLSIKRHNPAVPSVQILPQYQRDGLESQTTVISTAPTLVSPPYARHSFYQSPNISAPSSLPSIAVDLTSPRQAPKPPSKSSLRASTASAGAPSLARPMEHAPALIVERRLTAQLSFPFSLAIPDSPLPMAPWDPQTFFGQPLQRPQPPPRPLSSQPVASNLLESESRKSHTSGTLGLETGRT